MLLEFLFDVFGSIISFFLNLLSIPIDTIDVTEAFRLIFGYGIYIMGDATFLVATANILAWTALQFVMTIYKFIIRLIPMLG